MSDLELTMMRRVGELNKENARLKAEVERLNKFNEEAMAHIAKEERKSRERLDMEQAENARLKADVERLKEGNECLDQMHEKEMARSAFLCEEVNRTTAWGRGLESDLSWARAELMQVKAEVERLTAFTTRTIIPNEELQAQVEELTLENSQYEEHHKYGQNVITSLREEVERLKDAGEHLFAFAQNCVDRNIYPHTAQEYVDIWNAAVNGKSL